MSNQVSSELFKPYLTLCKMEFRNLPDKGFQACLISDASNFFGCLITVLAKVFSPFKFGHEMDFFFYFSHQTKLLGKERKKQLESH